MENCSVIKGDELSGLNQVVSISLTIRTMDTAQNSNQQMLQMLLQAAPHPTTGDRMDLKL
ncbi:putative motility protein [Bacillus sp. DJP31]|uniref:putative motility protein n=1 Tax=Bacillus sp. DJP31 TaxID=3409789 RepID=UPI003BB66331